ncbi:hypothetical protein VF14_10250 [Nostoc linckia z18]|uniref:Uncharacterized protein n=2 Tax=Nostoc linckia TaxID=92942 RepID=A0A9Q6EL08_NOSLI|nr:hypothetical protein [Nostoc linckia]PHK42675.1 hypothetical protein VF12_02010 [Nostoc linckia z15]PHK46621.1 hypothetical protein VF13_09915 [Nostoc linckia z16]PHJ60592.1 hypothetical protein VF02_22140 [Nostoc linckia z1]PHJ71201.1 hypothetical protein VF03_20880 [Nostoc linckia z2]PHJ72197.1 hypothetical protein VF05_04465 [Nostoc linckia z3]
MTTDLTNSKKQRILSETLASFQLVDGKIGEISLVNGTLYVHFQTDDEKDLLLVFKDVAGVEMFNIQNAELNKWTVSFNDPFRERVRKLSEKHTENLVCYAFWSPWLEEPLMRILASDFQIKI